MENIVIEIVNVAISHQPSKTGGYDSADITYKNKSFQDKIEAKKIVSFTNKEVFSTLKDAVFGETFTISREKNEKGYWDWITVSKGNAVPTKPEAVINKREISSNIPTKSSYETSEERAERQKLIVRQSSISSAVALAIANKVKDPIEVLAIAKIFEDFVFSGNISNKEEAIPEKTNFFSDMPDDLPT